MLAHLGGALYDLGNATQGTGAWERAIATLEQALTLARELGDRAAEGVRDLRVPERPGEPGDLLVERDHAEAGSGKPVIAVLAEFDALPGITQTAAPVRSAWS